MTDKKIRAVALRQMLSQRRCELKTDVDGRIRNGAERSTDVRDELEQSDACIQTDVEFALLQMRAETLTRIDEALVRLDAGEYGVCVECAGEISQPRLRALPFAVRCRACEERREQDQGRARQLARQYAGFSLFTEQRAAASGADVREAHSANAPPDWLQRWRL